MGVIKNTISEKTNVPALYLRWRMTDSTQTSKNHQFVFTSKQLWENSEKIAYTGDP